MERAGQSCRSRRAVARGCGGRRGAGTWPQAVFRPARRCSGGREDLPRSLRPAPDRNPARRRLSRPAGHAAAQLGQLGAGGLDVLGRNGRAWFGAGRVTPAHAGPVHPARVRVGGVNRHHALNGHAGVASSRRERQAPDPHGARAPASKPSVLRSSSSSGQ